jgi:hypothetical protein
MAKLILLNTTGIVQYNRDKSIQKKKIEIKKTVGL